MTNQHPLTDEMCDSFKRKSVISNENMRAAADWQLEMVFRFMKTCKNESDPESSEFYDLLIQEMMDEMRPQQEEQKGLTGPELLAKVKEMKEMDGSSDAWDVLMACGYVHKRLNGSEYMNLSAFYDALIEAHGIDMG